MGLFGSKISEKEFKEEQNRVDKNFEGMASRIRNFELEIEKFKTHINSLRGLVNRKISKDSDLPETKEFKSVDGLDSLRQ